MKITKLLADESILAEIGRRISSRRIELGVTQADVAREAGVAKRTVERVEAGASTQMLSVIRVFRVLDLMPDLDRAVPEPVPKPMDLLRRKGKIPVRASRKKKHDRQAGKSWRWKEDE